MAHRIREGMKETNPAPMGGAGKIIEADETFLPIKARNRRRRVFVNGKGWVWRSDDATRKIIAAGAPVRFMSQPLRRISPVPSFAVTSSARPRH